MTQVRWEEEEESKQGREARGRNDSRQQDTCTLDEDLLLSQLTVTISTAEATGTAVLHF